MGGEWEYEPIALGEVASLRSGFAFKSSDWMDNGVPVVKIANVKDGRLAMEGCSFVTQEVARSATEFDLEEGDILIAMTGYIGEVALIRASDLPVLVNQRVGRFSIKDPERLDRRFLFYLLRDKEIRAEIEGLGYGSAQPNVSPSLIHRVEVPLPPLLEQRAIAHILGTLDNKIEMNRRMNETLVKIAQAIFKSWFVDFDPVRAKLALSEAEGAEGRDPGLPREIAEIFPASFEDSELGEIPKGWKATKWGELVKLEYGKSLGGYAGPDGKYPVFGTNGRIGSHTEALCNHPGIVIGRKGAYRGIHFSSVPFFVIDTAFYVEPTKPIEFRWAYYELLRNDINSMDSGSAIPSTSREDFYSMQLLSPPIEVQQAFVRLLTPCWERQEQSNRASCTLATLRDALLPKLISGEIRVKDVERLL